MMLHCTLGDTPYTTQYNTLQHTATDCNTLQHTATHCRTEHTIVQTYDVGLLQETPQDWSFKICCVSIFDSDCRVWNSIVYFPKRYTWNIGSNCRVWFSSVHFPRRYTWNLGSNPDIQNKKTTDTLRPQQTECDVVFECTFSHQQTASTNLHLSLFLSPSFSLSLSLSLSVSLPLSLSLSLLLALSLAFVSLWLPLSLSLSSSLSLPSPSFSLVLVLFPLPPLSCYINDDDCFYYHAWRNNVLIAFGTLSSFLT